MWGAAVTLRSFYVVSPEYQTYGCADPPEPPEYGCDCVEVQARTKREAQILGVRQMLKQRHSWAEDNISDGRPPWKGIKVEEAVCAHGIPDFIVFMGKTAYVTCSACEATATKESWEGIA